MGMTINDYLAYLLAQDTGLVQYAPSLPQTNTRAELPVPAA